ncbi:hypothetical protein DSAG12_00621 [Promethearchaeum syntrophicum]|uniref:PIN domain-containing protein n=1 Tax=Promethearchaeum syntrophicum TaxID=2594042 RepID=A0A5B9D6S3_9ARCH|nr:hypothetical protein [Candidatus Prometheoarchaeum syntrophicum]QEE14804.1 hypothetical protein DSAG12_00621 [Candidatus Prometheoarchaeum syntrophicum]
MLLSFDTCSFLRIQHIFNTIDIDLRSILKEFRLVITEELRKEYLNYKLEKFFAFNYIFIPLSAEERKTYISKYLLESFDSADQDLIIVGLRDKLTIVTDDRDLFNQCSILNIPTFQLWSFCISLVKDGQLSKNQIHKCWKLWEEEKRYSKTTLKLIKKTLGLL